MTALDLSRSKLINCLFFSLGFGISKQYGGLSRKMMEIPGGKGSGMENPVGWGVKLEKKNLYGGGYGYFLESHNMKLPLC